MVSLPEQGKDIRDCHHSLVLLITDRLYRGRQRLMPSHGPTVLRPCAATNCHEDRDDAVAQGGQSVLVDRGTGEVAGSSPASVTISMKNERLA